MASNLLELYREWGELKDTVGGTLEGIDHPAVLVSETFALRTQKDTFTNMLI